MPELPETETIARDLDASVRDSLIIAVEVRKPDVLREVDADTLAAAIANARITRVWRRAKLVVLDLDRDHVFSHIVVQPRFTGGLLIDHGQASPADLAYVAITLHLSDGRRLHYRDVRRLGTVALMSPARFAQYSDALGIEPLDPILGDAEFSVLVRASNRPIKIVLMDQRRLAGIGNIYANEALWRAGIDPSREASNLQESETSALLAALREVLTASIAARGTSFRDYRDARGERGAFVEQLAAYGRGGEPCLRCGRRLIATHAIDGRGSVFCATCQR